MKIKIKGSVVYKDRDPIVGAKIKIWETDSLQKNNPDDLIVNDTTDSSGRFSGSGRWKDSGFVDVATYRYEVSYNGKVKKGGNITNPHNFFEELNTKWLSPAQTRITVAGKVTYKDGSPIKGARVQIWESDKWQSKNADDVIVDDISDSKGAFSGSGPGKDSSGIQTFRWKVSMPGTNMVEESKIKELPKSELNVIKTSWKPTTWSNWIGDHETSIEPAKYHEPRSKSDIEKILNSAVEENLKVKVVGSGHSHSKVAQPETGNILIDLKRFTGEASIYSWLKARSRIKLEKNTHSLIRVKSGTSIRELNVKILAPRKLGLINTGPFDGQTIAGVVNTNTHGTGIGLGGFADMVRSVEMFVIRAVAKGNHKVESWIIEPSNGISDPAKFRQSARGERLVQDDDVFYSVVCGYGLFGVATTYTLEVRDLYWLDENYSHLTWKQVKEKLKGADKGIPQLLKNNRRVKLYVHTAQCHKDGRIHDDTDCRLETWNENEFELKPPKWDNHEEIHKIWPPMRPRTAVKNVGKFVSGLTFDINGIRNDGKPSDITVSTLSNGFFREDNKNHFLRGYEMSAYYRAIRRARDNDIAFDPNKRGVANERHRIDNTKFVAPSEPSDFGPSLEICVPLALTVRGVELMMKWIARQEVNFVIPTGIRFTKRSKHYLSPAYEWDCTFIEIVGWLPDERKKDWDKFKAAYYGAFADLIRELRRELPDVRFHIGKYNTEGVKSLKKNYPRFKTWVEYYHVFNASGLLDCPNARKWKLDEEKPSKSMGELGTILNRLPMR